MAADRMTALTLDCQKTIFRLAERDHGKNRKAVSQESGINYDTLGTYWRGESVMPVPALLRLVDVIPDYLLSLLFDPVDRQITTKDGADGDLAAVGCEAAGFTNEYVEAVSDGNVTHIERSRLTHRARRLSAVAGGIRA